MAGRGRPARPRRPLVGTVGAFFETIGYIVFVVFMGLYLAAAPGLYERSLLRRVPPARRPFSSPTCRARSRASMSSCSTCGCRWCSGAWCISCRPQEAERLAEELRSCTIPVVGVLGNHDFECGHAEEVERILRQGGVRLLGEQVCEVKGVGFAGVKGFAGGFGERMLGAFGEPAIKAFVNEAVAEALKLENALRQLAHVGRKVVVLHYLPVADTAGEEPREIHPFLGSSRLAETIDRYDIAAVLHGHAHHGKYDGRTAKGIAVYNCAYSVPKPTGRPYALIRA